MVKFQEVFLIIISLFANLKLMSIFFFHETFLVYKMETFKNCKEVKHIMIMIIDSDFLSYVVFEQQLKITQHPPPLKLKKCKSPLFVKSRGYFWSSRYIEYESNGDRNKTLSIEEYLYKNTWKIQMSNTWKIQ